MKLDILGTEYEVNIVPQADDEYLRESNSSGYTDPSIHRIVVQDQSKRPPSYKSQADLAAYQQDTMRHEIIHAFLFEAGLGSECNWHTEECVDWFALMLPKIVNACVEAGAIG